MWLHNLSRHFFSVEASYRRKPATRENDISRPAQPRFFHENYKIHSLVGFFVSPLFKIWVCTTISSGFQLRVRQTLILDIYLLNTMSPSHEMSTLGHVRRNPLMLPAQVQAETRPSDHNVRAQSSGHGSTTATPKVSPNQIYSTLHDPEELFREPQLDLEPQGPPSITRTESDAHLTAVEDNSEASMHSGPNPFAVTLKGCFSPVGLGILALITAGVYFVFQYELSVEANILALRESCRSHPVSLSSREQHSSTAK